MFVGYCRLSSPGNVFNSLPTSATSSVPLQRASATVLPAGDFAAALLSRCAAIGLSGALSGCGGVYAAPPAATGIDISAPGISTTSPPGIHSVRGECAGRIALTPVVPHAGAEGRAQPLVYHCLSKKFEILNSGTGVVTLADLTLTRDGYYLHQTSRSGDSQRGGYFFYDHAGKQTGALPRPDDPAVHDLIVRDEDVTYIRYAPDWDSARCRSGAPLELELITERRRDGMALWKWSSKGQLDVSHNVATRESQGLAGQPDRRGWLRSIRNCYTALLKGVVRFETPRWFILGNSVPVFHLEVDDYIHANSIQWVEPSGDILVSARNLDTVFLLDRSTGRLKWSLGGKFAKATQRRPVGDPRGGFSHQHDARMAGNVLWVFDNGNLFPDLPSRAVGYELDAKSVPDRLVFEFQEPNGRQRNALGFVQLLADDQLLIGWGNVKPADRHAPQRGVSIVRLRDRKEVFSIDLSPGWISYRAKALQP